MCIALSGLVFMVWSATAAALNQLDSVMLKMQGGTTSMQEIADIAGSQTLTRSPYYDAVLYFIVCFWIFAVIDAYRIGKQREIRDKETPIL